MIPIYADHRSADVLEEKFNYCFFSDPEYQGGAQPRLTLTRIEPYIALKLFGVDIMPLPVLHGRQQILGFRIGTFAYLTDCSEIPEQTREQLQGLQVLILDALRNRPHQTHFTLEQAVNEVEKLSPGQTYLIHMSHEVEYEAANSQLLEMTKLRVELAYDGLEIQV